LKPRDCHQKAAGTTILPETKKIRFDKIESISGVNKQFLENSKGGSGEIS
jgi:hypothetical protein